MTNRDFQNRIVELLENGFTVLAESQRFVNQVLRRFRLKRLAAGDSAWDTPEVFTINRWMDSLWSRSWPEEWPASTFVRWRAIWKCLDRLPPPGPMAPDVGLVHFLDETFETLIRSGIDPGRGEPANRLVEWRREIWKYFESELAGPGLFHPALLPRKILGILGNGRNLPEKMAFAGFEFCGELERQLLVTLKSITGGSFLSLPMGNAGPEALCYPEPGQEIIGLMEGLVSSAAGLEPHEIAVVALDSDYSQAISAALEDLLGGPLSGELAAYNPVPDAYLSGNSLFQAAMLPLRFAVGGQSRRDFYSFLRSPYYGALSPWSRKFADWDLDWRNLGIEGGLRNMLDSIRGKATEIFPRRGEELADALAPLLDRAKKPASAWASDARRIWSDFEFPVTANELDETAWKNLQDLLTRFEQELGEVESGLAEFCEFLVLAASGYRVQKEGCEDAGIQVLGRLDARGLSFEKVFAPGLVAGTLPQPARLLPMLAAGERGRVLGGAPESQLAFSRYIFGNILAAAPEITLSRPAMSRDGETLLASPFWPSEIEKKADAVIAWKDNLPAMRRAEWVKRAVSGLVPGGGDRGEDLTADDFHIGRLPFPEPISVSALEAALLCAARFVFQHILRLDEMPEIEAGIAPPEKGKRVHEILAEFVHRAAPMAQSGEAGFDDLWELLGKVALEKISPDLPSAVWQVELDRLLGTSESPGLLRKWLEEEWRRIDEGWSWLCWESSFTDMDLPGSPARIKGRLDRIDSHADRGLLCWDYKTGAIPAAKKVFETNEAPQLPAYLLAVKKGLVRGAEGADPGKTGGGYIDLSAPGKVGHQLLFDPGEDWDARLSQWQKEVAEALNRIASGDISPRWLQKNEPCAENCPYCDLCGVRDE